MPPLPPDGYGRNKLPYPYSYVPKLVQDASSTVTGQTDARQQGQNSFTLCITDSQMLEILSALQAGADLIYPDRWMEIIQPFLAAREFPNNPFWSSLCSNQLEVVSVENIGVVVFWPLGGAIPGGYDRCIGQTLTEDLYPDLIEAAEENNWVGLAGNAPNRTFTLPDMRQRFAYHDNPPQAVGGESEVTLTVDELPAHEHKAREENQFRTFESGYGQGRNLSSLPLSGDSNTRFLTDPTGGDEPHNNMPPYLSGQWLMRTQPEVFDLTDFIDVFATNCTINKRIGGITTEVLNVFDCIDQSRQSSSQFDDAEDQIDNKDSNDCIWGAVSKTVDYIIGNALELLDLLEAAVSRIDVFFEWISKFNWWTPSARAIEVAQLVGDVAIAAARTEIQNEPITDGWKCDLFCRILANNGTLTSEIFSTWVNEDIQGAAPPFDPGGLIMRISALVTPRQWLFNRYALAYDDECSNDWQTLCDCGGCTFIGDFTPAFVDVKRGLALPGGGVQSENISGTQFVTVEITFPFAVDVDEVAVDYDRVSTSATADLLVQVPSSTNICEFDSDPIGRRTDVCNVGGISSTTVQVVIDQPGNFNLYSIKIEYSGLPLPSQFPICP